MREVALTAKPPTRAVWKRWLDWVLLDSRPISAGFIQGSQEVAWGAWLWGWWSVWDASTIYGAMGAVIPEDVAGTILVILGVPKLLLPIAEEGGLLHRAILASLLVAALWWACVVISCFEGNAYTTATNVYGGFGAASLWLWARLR